MKHEIALNKTSHAYKAVKELLDGEVGIKVRTGHYTGNGKHTKAVRFTADVTAELDRLGISYEAGNDAPRGGVAGDYIKLI